MYSSLDTVSRLLKLLGWWAVAFDIPLVEKRDVLRVIDASMPMGISVRLAAGIVFRFHRHVVETLEELE